MLKTKSAAIWLMASFAAVAPVLAWPAAAQTAVASPQAAESVIYEIKRGENLYTLAERYLDRIGSASVVQKLNGIADPRKIATGKRLRIPLSILRSEPLTARIVSMRGTVRVQQGARSIDAKPDAQLPQGTVIETGEDGFISLALPNGSRTSLPTRSRLSIVHLRRFLLTQSVDYDFLVEAGKANTKAAPFGSGGGLFRIRTPRAVAAVRGTEFRVGAIDEASLVEVLEGTVAAGLSELASVPIALGFGAVIANGGVTTEALLSAPSLVAPGKVQVDPLVRLGFEPVLGASGYRLQIAADASFNDVLAEARGESPNFELADIPNGGLFVRGSAIAASGLEGMTQTYSMRRALTALGGSAAVDADRLTFKWGGSGDGRRLYRFQLLRDSTSGVPIADEPGLESDGIALRALDPGTYFWRVGVRQFADGDVTENWLPFEKIIISAPER